MYSCSFSKFVFASILKAKQKCLEIVHGLKVRDIELFVIFAGILKAKQKCLEIVHGLEVRDIKSFVSWMKTFQVEQGAAGEKNDSIYL